MTKKELSQLYYLNREIEQLQEQLQELQCVAEGCTSSITGMPHASGTSDKMGKYAVEIADLRSLLDLKTRQCMYERDKLNRYIDTINNEEMRQILSLRYVSGLCWGQIAYSIGENNTADSVRKKCNRYIDLSA